jgi:hypothetical protein
MVFMAAVGLGCFALIVAALRRDWRPLACLAASGALAALFAAPKLMPLLRFVTTPDLVDIRYFAPEPDRVTPDVLQHLFTDAPGHDARPRRRVEDERSVLRRQHVRDEIEPGTMPRPLRAQPRSRASS